MITPYNPSVFNVSGVDSRIAAGGALGMLHAPTAPPPQAVLSSILELERIKVTFDHQQLEEPFYKIHSSKCKSWLCPKCRVGKGLALKESLMNKAYLFKEPRLYTITINREFFKNPAEAYHYVMDNKFIARLLTKEMKIKCWIWILEAQEKNGDGWPHWHILIDVADLPTKWYNRTTKKSQYTKPENTRGWRKYNNFFDLNKIHRLLHKWKIGGCYLSEKKSSFKSPRHAINYIVKYLIKTPERFFPQWMLHYTGLRFYNPSKALGSMSAEPRKVKPKEQEEEQEEEEPEEKEKKTKPRLPIDRISECGLKYYFSYYDIEQDKMIFTEPAWGLPGSIQKILGAVENKDLNFKTQKEYSIWGFKHKKDVERFEHIWDNEDLLYALAEVIESKKQEYLNQWDEA
jgi:hypothetical protein